MNKLILCEGKTDAILLSYYLIHKCGWQYSKSAPKGLKLKEDTKRGESVSWYQKGDDYLLICAVGSKNQFKPFFDEKIQPALVNSGAFSRIALIIDRDEEQAGEIEASIRRELPFIAAEAQNDQWIQHSYRDSYGEETVVDFLLLAVPHEQQGALETLLLDAISEDEYDRNIVEKSRLFVDKIAPEAGRYIGKRRLVLKAYLGVTWAVQSPQKVFDFIDEQLRTVEWEKSKILEKCFLRVCEI